MLYVVSKQVKIIGKRRNVAEDRRGGEWEGQKKDTGKGKQLGVEK